MLPPYGHASSDLRSAAHATKKARLRLVVSAMVSEARLVLGACFLLSRASTPPSSCSHSATDETLHHWITTLLALSTGLLQEHWHWSLEQRAYLHAQLAQLAAPRPWLAGAVSVLPFDLDAPPWQAPPRPYPASMSAFLHALRVGAPWALALDAIGGMPDGHLSADGRIVAIPAICGPLDLPDRRIELADPGDSDAHTLFFPALSLDSDGQTTACPLTIMSRPLLASTAQAPRSDSEDHGHSNRAF